LDPKLRKLADYFLAAKSAAAVSPKTIDPALLPHVFILDVEQGGAALRVRLAGTEFDRIFGRALEGLYMESFLHGPRGKDVLAGFHDCAKTHAPVWMRQVVRLPQKPPRCVEGIAIYLAPARIYGGLMVGELAIDDSAPSFERAPLMLPA
jgi:hypothetical protein